GDEKRIKPIIDTHFELKSVSAIVHTEKIITNDDKPTMALRQGQGSSMWMAIESVAKGDADCVVSSGNTGALMVLARKHLKMLPGIDRPAICTPMPTASGGQTVVLDLGANIDCTPDHLVQF